MKYYENRLSICRSCPESEPLVLGRHRCQRCSCIVELKALSPWSSCPAGLWLDLDSTDPELQDVVIADYWTVCQLNRTDPWAEACRLRYVQLFGDADVRLLYADLEHRRQQSPAESAT